MWLPLACPLLGTWPATQACALTGNRTGDPSVRRPALNPTEPHEPGILFFLMQNIPFQHLSLARWNAVSAVVPEGTN